MRILILCLIAAALGMTGSVPGAVAQTAAEKPFHFIALGDMPYRAKDDIKYRRLLTRIERENPAFVIHVGDIKSGGTPCTDAAFRKIRDGLNGLTGPVFYTPGDNEWTDCHRSGGWPLKRLASLRKIFFGTGMSLGKNAVKLQSQSVQPKFRNYPENTTFTRGGVRFALLHIVGSNNNLQRNTAMFEEHAARSAANIAWLKQTFAAARADGAQGVVLVFHADPQFAKNPAQKSGFVAFLKELEKQAAGWPNPILLIHGDSHNLIFDQPLRKWKVGRYDHVFRLEVPGRHDLHAVRVTVDPARWELFGVSPVIVRENLRFAAPPK